MILANIDAKMANELVTFISRHNRESAVLWSDGGSVFFRGCSRLCPSVYDASHSGYSFFRSGDRASFSLGRRDISELLDCESLPESCVLGSLGQISKCIVETFLLRTKLGRCTERTPSEIYPIISNLRVVHPCVKYRFGKKRFLLCVIDLMFRAYQYLAVLKKARLTNISWTLF